jgi:hypothetical protein
MTKQEFLNGFGILPSDEDARFEARMWRCYHRSDEGREEREALRDMGFEGFDSDNSSN